MRKYLKVIIPLFCLQVIFLPAGWILDSDMPFSIVLATTGIIAFFGLYDIGLGEDKTQENKEAALRFAIAGAIVFEYLVMVGIVAFFNEGPEDLPLITQAVISNFTAIVGVVIAFYFGSSAYIQANKGNNVDKPKDE